MIAAADRHLSEAAFGLGAGLFFIGKALDTEHEVLPIIYLLNEPVIMAMRRNLECLTMSRDGPMRREDVRLVR